jgi:hypothetical protein
MRSARCPCQQNRVVEPVGEWGTGCVTVGGGDVERLAEEGLIGLPTGDQGAFMNSTLSVKTVVSVAVNLRDGRVELRCIGIDAAIPRRYP